MEMASISPSPSYSPVAVPPPDVADSNSSGFNASSETTNLAPAPSSPLIFFGPPPADSDSPPPLPPADSDSQSPPPAELSPPAPTIPSSPPLPPAAIPPSLVIVPTPANSSPSPPILTPPPPTTSVAPPPVESPSPPPIPQISAPPPLSPPTNLSPPAPALLSTPPPSPVTHATPHTPPSPAPPQPETGSPPGNPSPASTSPPPPPPVSHSRKHIPQPTAPSPPPPSTASSPPLPPPPSTASPTFVPPFPPVHANSVDEKMQPSPPSPRGESSSNQTTVTTTRSGGQGAGSIAIIVSFLGFLALSLIIVAVWFNRRKRRKNGFGAVDTSPYASSPNSASSSQKLRASSKLAPSSSSEHSIRASKSWFMYEELYEATNEFSSDNILGEGGFGCVYKGVLSDGRQVAVKKLKSGSGQGEREFRAEVETISRIHHRHLVSMVGYCIAENQRLLVYDYVPNNTLHYHLHGEDKPAMNWASRVKVAAGAARGIAYLHEDCQPRIIHRDIKSTNILLDYNFEAQVADFGLAKLALELELYSHVSTRVMGTFGYLAPEYASTGKLTEKSDVFSFGVVLLELITGRKPVDSLQPLGDESLVEWARPLLAQAIETHAFDSLVDPKLGNDFVAIEMYIMIEVAAACVRHSAYRRPKMSQIVSAFDSMGAMPDLNNGVKPGESGIFNSNEHSAQIRMLRRMAFGDYNSSEIFNDSQSSWRTH